MSIRLIAEEALESALPAFKAAGERLPAHYNRALLEDPIAGRCLKFYLLLTEMPELLPEPFQPEQVFWSRYYWFMRYLCVCEAVEGFDAGLEQQAHQVLEHPQPPCEPDWTDLEAVVAEARRDAARPLGTPYSGSGGTNHDR